MALVPLPGCVFSCSVFGYFCFDLKLPSLLVFIAQGFYLMTFFYGRILSNR